MCEMYNNQSYREMIDYMEELSPPEKKRAINELINITYVKYNDNKKDNIIISENFIKHITEQVYDEYHVNIDNYSYAGWCVFVKNELITKICNKLNNFLHKKRKIKCGLHAGFKLINIYRDYLEKSLAPGGSGYLRAKEEFMIYI